MWTEEDKNALVNATDKLRFWSCNSEEMSNEEKFLDDMEVHQNGTVTHSAIDGQSLVYHFDSSCLE